MCLHTLQQEPKIAENDIIVWKLLYSNENGYLSPNQSFNYELGKVYKTEMNTVDSGKFATADEYEWVDSLSSIERKQLKIIAEGFHAYTDKNFIKGDLRFACSLIKGIVPKGSLYYTNHLGLIASNTIQMIEEDQL